MTAGLFVTGTDTGIGKTVVAAAILEALAARGWRAVGMKPVASGASPGAGGLRNEDAERLLAASAVDADYDDVNPYVFAPAIAPHHAALEAGVVVDPGRIRRAFDRLRASADCVVVEGVGGWLVPLAPGFSVEDLARMLSLPVVVVVGMRLGCINQALLSVDRVRYSGCRFAGWVANRCHGDYEHIDDNIDTIAEFVGNRPLADFPYRTGHTGGPGPDLSALAGAALPAAAQPTEKTRLID